MKESTNTPIMEVRTAWLIDTLRHHGKLTFGQIAALWRDCPINPDGSELPLRTFHYHRRMVKDMYGIDIVCDTADGYVYTLAHPEKLARNGVLSRMISAIVVHKLQMSTPGLAGRVCPEAMPGGYEHVAAITQAMARGRALELYWESTPHDVEKWSRKIKLEPYQLLQSGGDWWVVGRNVAADEIESCCLGDLRDMRVLDNMRFEMPADWDSRRWFDGCAGMLREEEVCRVVLRVFYHARRQLALHPLHPSQREIARDRQSVTYEYLVRPNYDFVQKLMSMTDQIIVEEPASLRNELNRVAFRLIDYYNTRR